MIGDHTLKKREPSGSLFLWDAFSSLGYPFYQPRAEEPAKALNAAYHSSFSVLPTPRGDMEGRAKEGAAYFSCYMDY
ncbi:MAG: hypothetical protein CSA95_02145 [Bacteroidetes bacterium]|nr:MAG: hypothetical protein CSA95_02145 [Bacteroidota bacterium]